MDRVAQAMDSLTSRTARAAQWRVAGSVVLAASQLAVSVLLARLLPPADFGVMAMAVLVLAFVQPITELGIGAAVVQRGILTDRHVRTAFTVTVLLGIALFVAVCAAAPWAAGQMRDPRVTPLLRVLASAFAIRGAAVVSAALLRRRLDFRRLFFIDAATSLAGSLTAAALAMSGYGVWSLVWGGVLQLLLASTTQIVVVRHARRPLLARAELADLSRFGLGSAAGGIVNYVARHGDNFVVGRFMGAASLGLYDRAYALMNVPFTYLTGAVSGVMLPAFAHVQSEPHRLRRGYLAMTQLTAVVAAPMMCILVIAAPYIIPALYGPRWSGVALPLQVLCVAGYFRAQYHISGVVVQSVGRVYSELTLQAGYALLVVGGSLAAWRLGLEGVAAAVSIAIVCMFFATTTVALGIVAISWRDYFRVQLPAVATAAATLAAALAALVVFGDHERSSRVVALIVVAASMVPWTAGLIWTLGQPELEGLSAHLPACCRRLIERRHRAWRGAQEAW